jgi:hypothetical protein
MASIRAPKSPESRLYPMPSTSVSIANATYLMLLRHNELMSEPLRNYVTVHSIGVAAPHFRRRRFAFSSMSICARALVHHRSQVRFQVPAETWRPLVAATSRSSR